MASAFADELEKLASVKEAGVFSSLGNWMARRGAAAAPAASNAAHAAGQAVAHAAPAAAQAGEQVATKAAPSTLRKAAPYLAAAGAGALGFQQIRKAGKDWETGRAMRLQQEAYSPT